MKTVLTFLFESLIAYVKRKHLASFKAKVALELIKGMETINQVCSRYSIHPTQAHQWKQLLLNNMENVFLYGVLAI